MLAQTADHMATTTVTLHKPTLDSRVGLTLESAYAGDAGHPRVLSLAAGSIAAKVGLLPGVIVVTKCGSAVATDKEGTDLIKDCAGPVVLEVLRAAAAPPNTKALKKEKSKRVQLVMFRGAGVGGPVDHDDDLASPPLGPTAAAHPARLLPTGTELGVKRALSFPRSGTRPSTPPCSPKLNPSMETPMPKRRRCGAPNAPQRNPLRADHGAPAGATIVDTLWRARHGSSGRAASRLRVTSRTLDESISDAVGLRARDRRLKRPTPRSTTTD